MGRSESGGFYYNNHAQYIVFVNNKDQFEWVGEFLDPTNIADQSIIYLQGFCDWNAHIVSPANISLGQLKQYINTGSYSGKLHGYVNFFSSTAKKMEPSPIYIEANYTYKDSLISQVNVNGITLNDFNKKPYLQLPFHDPIVTIQYNPNINRPLEFEGKINNHQTNGFDWDVLFYIESPGEISYEDLKIYISDKELRPPVFNLILITEDNKIYPISLSHYNGTTLLLDGKNLACYGMQLAPKRLMTFDKGANEVIFEMDSCTAPQSEFEDLSLHHLLIRELLYGPITGTLNHKGKKIKATLTYQSCYLPKETK